MIISHSGGVHRRIALLKLNPGYRWSGWFFNTTFRLLVSRERVPVPIEQEAGLCGQAWKGENILLPPSSQRTTFQPGQRSCYTDYTVPAGRFF